MSQRRRQATGAFGPCGRATAARLALLTLLLAGPAAPARALEPATIQLKWLHHFQFAGYYVALEQGFYREAGLEVTIREGGPAIEVEEEVAEGRADFGVGTSALLLDRARGRDLVVLGQVFQHSAAVLLTPRRAGITSVAGLKGRRVMWSNQHGDILALLAKHGLSEADLIQVPHQGDPRDLLAGMADVMVAYGFNEPYVLARAGEPYLAFSPIAAGLDFYGDNFFASRSLVESRPALVAAFREATLRGWRHALAHQAETADLILARYSRARSRDWLLFEASQAEALIQPDLVELGYQSPTRWRHIAEVFTGLGLLPQGFDPVEIIYAPRPRPDYGLLAITVLVAGLAIAGLAHLLLSFRTVNRRLQAEVAERQASGAALAEREARLRATMEAMPVAIAVQLGDRIEYVNQAFVRTFGWSLEDLPSARAWFERAYPDPAYRAERAAAWREATDQTRRGDLVPPREARVRCGDGASRTVLISAQVLGDRSLAIFTDITERERLQAELLKLRKLESVGVLAGGIAHDFNNLLTAILGNVSLARSLLPSEGEADEVLGGAEAATLQAAELARQLLTFAKGGEPVKRAVAVRPALEAASSLVLRGSRAVVRLEVPEGLRAIEADEGQMGQVFTNLVLNALQAMPEGGRITLTARDEDVGEGQPLGLAPGPYVRVAFRDTGVGIPAEHLAQIFDPYFTTKAGGSGLGLASVHSIVRRHGGAVTVESAPGAGSTFELWLPASAAQPSPPAAPLADARREPREAATVLVMDDEPMIRDLARRILVRLGYQVQTCQCGEEAIELHRSARAEGRPYAAIIMDLTIRGGMGGAEAAGRILADDPAACLVVSSGYSEDPVMAEPARFGFQGSLAKPYQAGEVARVLERVCNLRFQPPGAAGIFPSPRA